MASRSELGEEWAILLASRVSAGDYGIALSTGDVVQGGDRQLWVVLGENRI